MHDNTQHLYNNLDLRKLLIPIIVEQLLSHSGTVCLICRGRDPVLPVSRQPEQKGCQPFCAAGFVCHGYSVCSFIRFLPDIP